MGEPVEAADAILAPGFVDIHIHGAFGTDFMSATRAEMDDLGSALGDIGYETYLPTTVTASPEAVLDALSNLPVSLMVGGFHLEGPFISPDFPGAQPPSAILDPPAVGSAWDPVLEDPRLRVITVAPERPNALPLIQRLSARGVIVSMGHTNCTFAEGQRAVEAGARHTTHTYNAMRPLHHREAGMVGFALSSASVTAELIYDRVHVCPEAAGLLIQCKGADGVIAVSDSTLASGLPPGQTIDMWGLVCVTSRGQIRLKSNGALAGSAITLLDAFRNLAADFGPEFAMRATSLNPRRALRIATPPAVWSVFDLDLNLVKVHHLAC